jgi:hypothetical protein
MTAEYSEEEIKETHPTLVNIASKIGYTSIHYACSVNTSLLFIH